MDLVIRKIDLLVLVIAISVCAGVAIYHKIDSGHIDEELRAFASMKITQEILPEDARLEDWEIITLVKSAKTFNWIGTTWGAIHVFMRQRGDVEMRTFKGVEYYLKRQGDKWIQIDSAGCGALSHHVEGFKEFERLGLEVASDAYDIALGFKKNDRTRTSAKTPSASAGAKETH